MERLSGRTRNMLEREFTMDRRDGRRMAIRLLQLRHSDDRWVLERRGAWAEETWGRNDLPGFREDCLSSLCSPADLLAALLVRSGWPVTVPSTLTALTAASAHLSDIGDEETAVRLERTLRDSLAADGMEVPPIVWRRPRSDRRP